MTDDFCLRWSSYSQQLGEALRNLLDKELLVDVTLACDGRSIRAHRAILSACSTYFQELFQESVHPHPIVILKDVRYQELEALVRFMYHGEVTVTHDTLQGFLHTAETLHVRGLTNEAFSGHSNNSMALNNNRQAYVERHPEEQRNINTTSQAVSPISKRIKLEQSSLPTDTSHLSHQLSNLEQDSIADDVCITNQHAISGGGSVERTEDLQVNQDQFHSQRSAPMTSMNGLSQLVMPLLQDDGLPSNQYLGVCQNISNHQQLHNQPPNQSQLSSPHNNGSGRPFRQRVLYNQEQLLQLEAWYRQDRYPSGTLMREYADTLSAMAPNTPGSIGAQPVRQNVDYWFQNRRRKDSHPEVMQQREKKKLAKIVWGNYTNNMNSISSNVSHISDILHSAHSESNSSNNNSPFGRPSDSSP